MILTMLVEWQEILYLNSSNNDRLAVYGTLSSIEMNRVYLIKNA